MEGLSIDRKDSCKGYNPENCRFISIEENTRRMAIRSNNAANTKIDTVTAIEIATRYKKGGISQQKLAIKYDVAQTTISRIIRDYR